MGSVDTILEHFDDPDALSHYGVKGMKWGVRRSQRELDSLAGRVRESRAERSKRIQKGRDERFKQKLKRRKQQVKLKEVRNEKQRLKTERVEIKERAKQAKQATKKAKYEVTAAKQEHNKAKKAGKPVTKVNGFIKDESSKLVRSVLSDTIQKNGKEVYKAYLGDSIDGSVKSFLDSRTKSSNLTKTKHTKTKHTKAKSVPTWRPGQDPSKWKEEIKKRRGGR